MSGTGESTDFSGRPFAQTQNDETIPGTETTMNTLMPHDLRVGNDWAGRLLPEVVQPISKVTLHRARRLVGGSASPFDLFRRSGVIFVHVPKNAGKTITGVIYDDIDPIDASRINAHHSAQYLRLFDRRAFDQGFKFAIVRDPRTRFVSAFHYLKSSSKYDVDRNFAERELGQFATLSELCAAADLALVERLFHWPHFRPQVSFLCDRNGEVLVDALVLFERMGTGMAAAGNLLGRQWDVSPQASRHACEDVDAVGPLIERFYPDDVRLHEMVSSADDGLLLVAGAQRPRL